jgi:hypothetical protein
MTIQAILISVSNTLLKPAVPILIGVALVVFFWGLVKYLNAGFGDIKKVEEARNLMIWGVISLTVMVSVWGIVKVLQGTFFKGVDLSSPPAIPYFGGGGDGGAPDNGIPAEDYDRVDPLDTLFPFE